MKVLGYYDDVRVDLTDGVSRVLTYDLFDPLRVLSADLKHDL